MKKVGWTTNLLEYINMEGEDDFEVEYSTEELMQLVQDRQEVNDPVKVDTLIDDSNDVESKAVKLSDAQKSIEDLQNFMASSRFSNFQHYGVVRDGKNP